MANFDFYQISHLKTVIGRVFEGYAHNQIVKGMIFEVEWLNIHNCSAKKKIINKMFSGGYNQLDIATAAQSRYILCSSSIELIKF